MFKDAKAKLDRADKHIVELTNEFAGFSKLNPDILRLAQSASGTTIEATPPPLPDAITTILCDTINNLRSALDLLVFPLAKDGKRTCFPFAKDKDGLPKAVRESGIESQEVRDYIEHAVVPCGGGDDSIYALHNTDITHKHHTLIPTQGGATISGINMVDGRGNRFINATLQNYGGGLPLAVFDTPVSISNMGSGSITMYFTAASGFGTQPIIETLLRLSKKLRGIVADIERLVAQGA